VRRTALFRQPVSIITDIRGIQDGPGIGIQYAAETGLW
jgi:hypothetical protein